MQGFLSSKLSITSSSVVENVEELNFGITNFDNVLYSMTSMFIVLLGEGWVDILYIVDHDNQYWDGAHPIFCSLLMISCILFGNFILFNLFLGLISYTFDRAADDGKSPPADTMADKDAAKAVGDDEQAEADLNKQIDDASEAKDVAAAKYEESVIDQNSGVQLDVNVIELLSGPRQ